ncbi:hypothetical protein QOZ80_8AG0640850 [Eleusine coracana subsp. coracana]|nr:hypothetical protein QOZ80_8AG0640850 [Eleusine coracana subsp. coracana]
MSSRHAAATRPMSSRPGRRRFDPEPEPPPRGDRRRPLGPDLRRPQQLQHRPDDAGDGADLISGLPDDLLREILARLRCARAAARTSTLSRRWLRLWRQLQHLYLRFRGVTPSDLLDVLAKVPSSGLALLDISVPLSGDRRCRQACIASLLRTAASLGPLEFIFSAEATYISVEVPNFHRAESITLEVLAGNQLELDTASDFPMLERLSVSGCYFNFTDLLSRCPRLRALRVGHISGYPDYVEVRVHSKTLRELHVDGLERHINIKAPLLERLSLSFSESYLSFYPSDFPCLRSLYLHHPLTHPRPSVHLWIRSTMIEEIVLHGMEIISGIYVDALSLKILTLEHVHVSSPIRIVAPMLKMFTLRLEKGSNVKMSLSAPALGNLL